MEYLIIGVFTAFNFIILKVKFDKQRYGDFILDLLMVVVLASLLGGTLGGMITAIIASSIVSFYLLFNPPKMPSW